LCAPGRKPLPEVANAVVFVARDVESEWARRARTTGCRVLEKPIVEEALTSLVGGRPVAIKTERAM
jgi:hypothetical protein